MKSRILKELVCSALLIITLVSGNEAAESVKSSLKLCFETIIPSIYIYMVVCPVLAGRVISLSGKHCETAFLIIGLMCGSPSGSYTIAEMSESGNIEKSDAEALLILANNPSLPFIIGVAGVAVMGSVYMGIMLAVFKLASSFTAYKILTLNRPAKHKEKIVLNSPSLTEAISKATSAVISICGCVVFFGVASDIVCNIIKGNNIAKILIKGIIEFSGGVALASGVEKRIGLVITGFILGFGGMCVSFQVSLAVKDKLSMKKYYIGKIIDGITMSALTFAASIIIYGG